MPAYVFTTSNSTICICATGSDVDDAKKNAEQAASSMQGVTLTGQQEYNHSVIVNLAITILNKAKSDDVLMQKLVQKFGVRAKLEVRNDVNDDGSVRKHFYINDVDRLHLDLKNKLQADSYEDKGFSDEIMETLVTRLEYFVSKDEIVISANGEEESNTVADSVALLKEEEPLPLPESHDEVHAD